MLFNFFLLGGYHCVVCTLMACQSTSVDDLVRLCGLRDEDLNKEITRYIFHEIEPAILDWRLLAPILLSLPGF